LEARPALAGRSSTPHHRRLGRVARSGRRIFASEPAGAAPGRRRARGPDRL